MREFIDRTGLVGKLQILTNCNFESANSTVEALPKVTEQEIVKPYLKKLKEQINEQIDGGLHNNDYGVGWDDALSETLDMIDKILSEQE